MIHGGDLAYPLVILLLWLWFLGVVEFLFSFQMVYPFLDAEGSILTSIQFLWAEARCCTMALRLLCFMGVAVVR